MKKPIIVSIFIAVAVLATALGSGFYIYKTILNIDTIYKGISIDGYDVSNKTMEQALKYIKEKKEMEIPNKSMNLLYEEKIFNIKITQLGFSYKYETAVKTAYKLGRQGNVLKRLRDIMKIKNGVEVSLNFSYQYSKIEDVVKDISRQINREKTDASIEILNGKITINDEIVGKKLMSDKLSRDIIENINLLKDIEIPVEDIQPRITKAFISRIDGIIGEFSTSFKGSSSGRIENIKLSAKAISNKLISPGEEVSYNNTTGPRESKNGYKEANVIIGGELTPGLGGGVCQTSTTMYNALLLADITILERHPHSIPANYVPYGQDAAVAYGYLDLRFRNDFDFPIYTYAKVVGSSVHIYIYGDTKAKDYQVKINPVIVEKIYAKTEEIYDEKLSPGTKLDIQKGRTGYKVNTFKSIIKSGKVVSKEQITTDHYRKKDYIYKVGPLLQNTIKDDTIIDENIR
ncbi:VanW family protein [Tissierella sp.]|uniref:VanW family protein n=1 Tax=Tissierella sp. TaxID=41274 RepID=UPI0028650E9B|nr:VanW family protein [Tissierella sp.]MDR7855702.1 VanW family protein [Tissierella sp.]